MSTPTVAVAFSDLVDDVEQEMYRANERPAIVTMGTSNAVTSTSDSTFTLDSGTLQVSDTVQFGSELMAVTGASSGTYTVVRGFDGSPLESAVTAGTVGYKRPSYPRHRVEKAVRRSLGSLQAHVPLWSTTTVTVDATDQIVDLPASVESVLDVQYYMAGGRVVRVGGWEFNPNVPTSLVSTGKALVVPATAFPGETLYVTTQNGYRWVDVSAGDGSTTTSPDAADTVELPEFGVDLPVLWASAWLIAGREVSRTELDTVSEWSDEAARRQGVNLRLLRDRWSMYYQRIDEVKRTMPHRPMSRPYIKMRSDSY